MTNLMLYVLFLTGKKPTGELTYKCHRQSCRRVYKTRSGIHNHLKYECGVKPKFFCNMCNKYFKQPVSYKAHMLNVHKQLSWK